MFKKYINFSISLSILGLFIGGIVQWLDISVGSLVDWLIGIASFWWLLIIVTIPWNIYFDARETINEAKTSQEKNLSVNLSQLNYVRQVARWSIVGAIALHLVSAAGLYLLAATGISNVGYVSSGLTLLLTILRPASRGYQYLEAKLIAIKKEVKYPREDAVELRDRLSSMETAVANIELLLDTTDSNSLISKQQQTSQENRGQIAHLLALLEEYKAKNTVEHKQLRREAQNAIALLNEDSQFLSHVKEIIRFVKTA